MRPAGTTLKPFLLVLALVLAGCTSQALQAPLSARIVLPVSTMAAGSSISGKIVVENNTGHALLATGCKSLFAVALGNDRISPDVVWRSCLQTFTIPEGESSYPVIVTASYSTCSPPLCTDGSLSPSLPPGDYRAMLFQQTIVVPVPPPIPIRVTP